MTLGFHTDAPPANWTRLQKLVWTMRKHGNEAGDLNLEVLARHNKWTSADELMVEFAIQRNGSNKLPEEAAVSCETIPTVSDDDGGAK